METAIPSVRNAPAVAELSSGSAELSSGSLGKQTRSPKKFLWENSSIGNSSDRDLLERTAKGDQLSMQCLFARHKARVFSFVFRMVGDRSLAEDLVSEIFIEVWRCAHWFKGNSKATTWILSIARFNTISLLRRRKPETLYDFQVADIPDLADDPESTVQKQDQVAILRKCMRQLSPLHREIIDLTYYQERSIDEAAAILGVPSNTVKTRRFNARKHMSKLLREAGIDRLYQ